MEKVTKDDRVGGFGTSSFYTIFEILIENPEGAGWLKGQFYQIQYKYNKYNINITSP